MEIPITVILIVSILACIFSIASTSIGVQAFNKNADYKKKNPHNFNFLVFNLVVSIIALLLSITGMVLHFRK
jgi:hypothetical protein